MMLVVCPTPRGGHIEHAANIARAAFRADGGAVLVSRRGSRAYLAGTADGVAVREVLPDVERWSLPRPVRSAVALVLENLLLVQFLLRHRRELTSVLLEEPRFPLVCALRALFPPVVLFVHNARNHATGNSLWVRFQDRMQSYMASRLKCVVHGAPQFEELRSQGVGDVAQVPLPGFGAVESAAAAELSRPPELDGLDEGSFALCLGEMRENKGFHHAIAAGNAAGCPLVVAGAAHDDAYLGSLRAEAGVESLLLPRFLDAGEFSWLLANCAVLLLPYGRFAAQSGPLSRAMALGKPVIISDNPALEDQARGYVRAVAVDPADTSAFAALIRTCLGGDLDHARHPVEPTAPRGSWETVVEAIRTSAAHG
ncbi:glycosyltransferase involved in cell wall biosynthesis [Nocardioides thalensis]|uniref:Glycosyltransferase involved in cell wall biosynthesis n=1 Tax=Nocardioides thalensis TaxID=1914755 RepID=A0A853C8T7_9ACTN|nr:glycosyltransferase [Nocardioides thalensis]NYJ02848.1 glycosyltransferase involved in cell wall biosynthesis [Nocardioides thalensis]